MPLTLATIPCLADNYAFLLHDEASGATALFDAPESWPIRKALDERGWKLSHLFITHHHPDHIDGVPDLVEAFGPQVIGNADDKHPLPKLDVALHDGDRYDFAGHEVQVLDVSGHTLGHVAYFIPDAGAAFTGDSLMALGCGRVFEGTKPQMWESLSRFLALPGDTLICSGHEYTAANARFAVTIEPDNPALRARQQVIAEMRAAGEPTVPSHLAEELATNPFIRANRPEVKAALGMEDASDAEVFAEIRTRKDNF